MGLKKLSFYVIFALLLTGTGELFSRVFLCFCGYSFWTPSDYIFDGFYKNLKEPAGQRIGRNEKVTRILILGGSVVSSGYSNLDIRLDTILAQKFGKTRRFEVLNVAAPGHTSLDNLLKYRLLKRQRFDLVIYYEAINETRFNNIPPEHFRADYAHVRWYSAYYQLLRHPEINITVIPYLVDKLISSVKDKLEGRIYIDVENINPQFVQYGRDIKTEKCYRANIEEIVKIANSRGDKLILIGYASYFPKNVILTGGEEDMQYFAGCKYASPTRIWGNPENVKKGIAVHNSVLRGLVEQYHVPFLDMDMRLPQNPKFFCDVCHVSEPGARRFADEIAQFIIRHGIVQRRSNAVEKVHN